MAEVEGTLYRTLDAHPHVRLLFSTAVDHIVQDLDGVRVDISRSGGGPLVLPASSGLPTSWGRTAAGRRCALSWGSR